MVKLCQHVFLSLVLLIYAAHPVVAQQNTEKANEESAGFWSQFVDQDDAMLDVSQWLLDPMFNVIISGKWREGYEASDEMLDEHARKYGLQDQDWREGYFDD